MAMTMNLCGLGGGTEPRGARPAIAAGSTATAVSRKMRSPQMTGVDELRPGIGTFHRTFFVSLHSTGGVAVRETPVANGPRHWGQNLSADCSAVSRPPGVSTEISNAAAHITRGEVISDTIPP